MEQPIRLTWDGERGDWPNPGDYGWTSGAGLPSPGCHGCGAPVEWRDLRWTPDGDVERVDAWHPGCRVRAGRAALAAAGEDLVESGRLVGRALVGVAGPTLVAFGDIVGTGLPIVVGQGRAAVAAAREVIAGGRLVARRRVRGLRLDRVGRPVGAGIGIVVDRAARVGWRLDLVRARGLEAWSEWRRGVGYTRAWRLALDGHDEVGPVVASGVEPFGFRWAFDGIDTTAGEAGPAAGGAAGSDVVAAFRAHFRGIGPTGHGDVDTPPQQRGRNGRGRKRPGQE